MNTKTYQHRVEIVKTENGKMSNVAFDNHYGKANYNGLSEMVNDINKSFEFGGVNFTGTYPVMKITEANLVNQKTGEIVAKFSTELFTVEM
jgi:hypothetical protein